ncbi:hypothetical protein TorRG33x02_048370 [Trema orientale]|uniref:FAS1 domain containing protein n=1 Tax=Trema orientale TaxID=63057 RepID=A0A2P5FND2_TREOI|nr:hypothetical protein TorRG33x02_048370 [Trema orientale]
MASKQQLFFYLFLFLLIILSQLTPPTQPIFIDYREYALRECGALYYTNSTSVTLVAFDRIAKALRDTTSNRHKVMTEILERNLYTAVPPHCRDFLFFVDRHNRFTMFDNNTITLFVPLDDAIRFGEGISLQNQIVMSKVDKEAFESGSLSKDSTLAVCGRYMDKFYVTEVSEDLETVSIEGVKITQCDGHVIVHATDGFFERGGTRQERINTDEYEVV